MGVKFIYKLTVFETHRTETEFESSYIFKVFIFDFVNVYSSFIYLSIFKVHSKLLFNWLNQLTIHINGIQGRFYNHPGDDAGKAFALYTVRADMCDPSGCFFELCIQLAIVMIGRQLFNHFWETGIPYL